MAYFLYKMYYSTHCFNILLFYAFGFYQYLIDVRFKQSWVNQAGWNIIDHLASTRLHWDSLFNTQWSYVTIVQYLIDENPLPGLWELGWNLYIDYSYWKRSVREKKSLKKRRRMYAHHYTSNGELNISMCAYLPLTCDYIQSLSQGHSPLQHEEIRISGQTSQFHQ